MKRRKRRVSADAEVLEVRALLAQSALLVDANTDLLGSEPRDFVELNDHVVFTAVSPENGREVWTTDGTPEGTAILEEINPGPDSSVSDFDPLLYDGFAYFTLSSDPGVIYRTDGTPSGTSVLHDFGTDFSVRFVVHDQSLVVSVASVEEARLVRLPLDGREASTIYFGGASQLLSTEFGVLFQSEGVTYFGDVGVSPVFESGNVLDVYETSAGTLLRRIRTEPAGYAQELWKMRPENPSDPQLLYSSSNPIGDAYAVGDTVLFVAEDELHGREIWRTDGTPEGTTIAADLEPGSRGSSPLPMAVIGTTLFVEANGTVWSVRADGSALQVSDRGWNSPQSYAVFEEALIYNSGDVVVRSDGTVDGTMIIEDEMRVREMATVGGGLLFLTSSEAFVSDGSPNNATSLGEIPFPDSQNRGIFSVADVDRFEIRTNGGNDTVNNHAVSSRVTAWLGSGDDEANLGKGHDTIYGGAGRDTIRTGDGHDLIFGGAGRDQIDAGRGRDRVFGNGSSDNLNGGPGRDTVNGGKGADTLIGAGGNDKLDGAAGNDSIVAGSGDDTVWGRGGDDQLTGSIGDDLVYGGGGMDVLLGGKGDDRLFGGSGRDFLLGADGNDSVVGGLQHDIVAGGSATGNLDAWRAVLQSWQAEPTYARAVDRVRTDHNLARSGIIRSDTGTDTLRGSGGLDLFFGTLPDVLSDRLSSEVFE